jgi:hypothetical protein
MTAAQLIDKAPPETLDAIDKLVKDAHSALEKATQAYGQQYDKLVKSASAARAGAGAPRAKQSAARSEATGSRAEEPAAQITDPISDFGGVPYQWFDLIAVGPFQPIQPLGPFAPARVIRSGEIAVLLAAVWRNPFPLPFGPNPSAAQIMAGQRYTVRGQTVNVNDVANGPDLGPVANTFGAGNVDIHPLVIPSVPAPADGAPRLLDISLTIDVGSVANGLPPFAGYASRWLQLDSAPPFLFPTIPGVGPVVVPGTVPGFINDSPVRVLIYS